MAKRSECGANRDAAGRWLPGHAEPGPGRPPGIDFRKLVLEHRADTIEQTLLNVFDALAANASFGDSKAASLLFDRLSGKVRDEVAIEHSGGTNITIVTGVPKRETITDDDADLFT